MARKKRVRGVDKVLKNLNKEVRAIEGRSLKGLIRAAIIIIQATDKETPMVPIDDGNLRASRFVITSRGETPFGGSSSFEGDDSGKLSSDHSTTLSSAKTSAQSAGRPTVILGFSAYYAWYVHENVGANFGQPKEGQKGGSQRGAKYFEAHLKNKRKQVLEMIRQEARVKK